MRLVAVFVRGLLDRILLVSAAVGGGLVPGFIAQYQQRLGGRLDQARLDLAAWQKVADQFFQGNLDRLIQYHLDSNNATFHSEGSVIRSLVDSVRRLQEAVAALQGNVFQQSTYLARHLDIDLARATLTNWSPTLTLSFEGLLFALAFALMIWCLFHLIWLLLALVAGALSGSGYQRPRQSRNRA
jgi:hypothetical protein